ncbi:MAG: endonuclease III [Nitrospiria bacterium]
MTKKPSSSSILKLLNKAVPEPRIELHFSNPMELLVATILSAQCTDERVNKVTEQLFKKYKSPHDFANADLILFESEIKPTGFFKNKAKNIIAAAHILLERFDGKLPATLEELITLPGVGRKTANVILGECFHLPVVIVDTHVKRVSKRLGLTRSDDPDIIETDLQKIFPQKNWLKVSQQLLLFGRYTCTSKSPKCEGCLLFLTCLSRGKW